MPEKSPTALAFGGVLKRRRAATGQSQEALAEAADIHPKYVGMLERGLRQPALDVLLRLAAGLGVPADELVREVEAELKRLRSA